MRIGIVDTGVDLAHEDLAGRVVAHTSCRGSGGDPAACTGSGQDEQGHGIRMAGIAAAIRDNGRGVAGVAPDAQLVVAKVLGDEGGGSIDDINAGIRWVVDHGARVVNLSLGDPRFVLTTLSGTSLAEGVEYAWEHGAVPVLASGNTNPLGDAKWGVVAPGGLGDGGGASSDMLSTFWVEGKEHRYAALAGTSMAAPHVSGAVALLLAQGYGQAGAVERLLETADDEVACGLTSVSCAGQLDVAAATTSR